MNPYYNDFIVLNFPPGTAGEGLTFPVDTSKCNTITLIAPLGSYIINGNINLNAGKNVIFRGNENEICTNKIYVTLENPTLLATTVVVIRKRFI